MKVLILGASGQVGRALGAAAWPEDLVPVALARPAVDLTRPDTVMAALERHAPGLVINAGAYTAVDKAEAEPERAFAVNRDGPAALAAACAARALPLIHLSTDYVFDGRKPGPYKEDDPVHPLGVYGASKAAGEAAVRAVLDRHLLIRTTWVYAAQGTNFVRTMLRLAGERDEIRVVADQVGAPTAADDIAAALIALAGRVQREGALSGEGVPWGTYHLSAAGETSWHGVAERVFAALERHTGRRPHLTAITTDAYPTAARRPANSRLDCSRIRAAFGLALPPWEQSLDRVLHTLLTDGAGS